MIGTKLYWVKGPWPGKLAIAARPRGDEWLDDEMRAWRAAGVDTVVSLLTRGEEADLGLEREAAAAQARRMRFWSFPIRDREVPESTAELGKLVDKIDSELAAGKNVVLHCRQGVGRAGVVAACLLLNRGVSAVTAIQRLNASRGVPIPETIEQRQWIDRYATRAEKTA